MIALPVWANVAIGVFTVVSFYFAGQFKEYAYSAMSPYVPRSLNDDGISRIHLSVYAMGPLAPYLAKKAYVRSQLLGFIAFLGVFIITLQTHRVDAMILECIFLIFAGWGVVDSYRKLRASLAAETAQEKP